MLRASGVWVGLLVAFQANAEEPQWLREARALEAKAQAAREFKSEDGFFKATVPAEVIGKIVKEQGSYTVQIDIGSEDASLYCEVFPEGVDMAEMMRATFQVILKNTREAKLEVRDTALLDVDAGTWGSIPYMKATWDYEIHDGKELLLAGMRQYTFEKSGHGVYCGIIELGYGQTLENVVRAFAESVQFREPALTPHYSEVNVITMADRVVGVSRMYLQRDAEGDILTKVESSVLIGKPDGSATTQEMVRNEWSNAEGAMINAGHVLTIDGKLTTRLALKQAEDHWVISGTHDGKEMDQPLDAGTAPTGTLKLTLDTRQLLAEQDATGGELSALVWDGENPTKLTGSNLKVQERAGNGLYKADVRVGGTTADIVLEQATGSALSAEHKVGATAIRTRRVNVTGKY